jgi:hypothetical protein
MKKYSLSVRDRVKYMCIVLLQEIINFQTYFPTKLMGNDTYLGPYLDQMVANGTLTRQAGEYIPTELGRTELANFYAKYYEYLKMFDIFCAVDLEAGEFAFSRKNDESFSDVDWFAYLEQERFSDVRVAVADFKGLDPNEIIFMSFLTEGRFETVDMDGNAVPNWQYELTNEDNSIWNEIEDISNSSIDVDYLRENGVLEDVIKQGTQIAMDLIRISDDLLAQDEADLAYEQEDGEVIYETTTYVDMVEMPCYEYDYWDPYYDPYYVSPIWLLPVLLW